jgi:ATP-binding cassette subfamily B protein
MAERRSLRKFLRPYRDPLAVGTALTFAGSLLDLASPWPLKVAVDNAIGGRPLGGWLAPLDRLSPDGLAAVAALAGVTLVAAGGVIGYLTTYLLGAAAERVGADIRAAAFGRLQHLSLRFHDRNRTGDLVARLTSDVSRVQDVLVAWFETLIPALLRLVGMLAVMFAVDPGLALAALAITPLLVLQVLVTRPLIKSVQREARERFGGLAARATDLLRNVRAVQAFSRQREEEERFRRESIAATRSAVTALDISARYSPLADLVLAVGAGLLLWLGVVRVTSGRMTLGVLLVVLTYLSSLYSPIRSLVRLVSTLAKGAASRERLTEIFAGTEEIPEDPAPVPVPGGACSLAVRAMSFAYRSGAPVLRDLSFHIEHGETVCMVGPTGAGKSTLLSLLLRLYDPDAGTIELGGVDIRRFGLQSLRERVALVPQDPWMLDGTIAENISFGRTGATDEEIRTAGRLALVDEFASRLPDGYDTPVGESGILLSGGQRRRIALARALVRDASFLLLDEPTSGLDAASEATVIHALRRVSKGRTVLIASHRLKIAERADRVVVLRGGRAVEQGPPARLLAAGGVYARLWALQNTSGTPASGAAPEVPEIAYGRR